MKEHKIKFVKRGTLFLLIALITILLINQAYITKILPKKQVFRKETEWQTYKSSIPNATLQYALFGDSHTLYASNPNFINNSYNFASSAEGYIETYYKLRKIIEIDNIEIKTIILEVDPHTFSEKTRANEGLFHELRYYTQFIPLKEIAKHKEQSIISLAIENHLPIIGKGDEILSQVVSSEIDKGWISSKKVFEDKDKQKIARTQYKKHFTASPNLIQEKTFTYFKELLKFAKENEINIVLVTYPLTKEYQKEIENLQLDTYYNTILKEANTISTSYHILEYQALFLEHPEYFGDADHLNHQGAEQFSKKLQEDLITLIFK
ncbi:MAG: hypothetical protein O2779_00190 [Nanoarchaeota archaeon]|nr:hypothetical protein [Nanoarchaeota archaeon]